MEYSSEASPLVVKRYEETLPLWKPLFAAKEGSSLIICGTEGRGHTFIATSEESKSEE